MMAMAGLLLALSIAGNVFQLYAHTKKPKPRKELGPAPERKGLLGKKHVLERIYNATAIEGYDAFFYDCSCGASYTRRANTNEAMALKQWKDHVALFKEFSPEGGELAAVKKELDEFKTNCICHNL